jgi:threonine/homoserine/homoserine lactone efflux protein
MILLVIGLLLGIAYLVYVAIAARSWQDWDESQEQRPPLLPVRRIR